MILPLRRAHRSVFAALALLLPALLVSAWRVRPEPPTQELPPELLPASPTPPALLGTDELVYWTAATDQESGALPADAELIGTVRSGALNLVAPAGKRALRFSLPQRRIETTEKGP